MNTKRMALSIIIMAAVLLSGITLQQKSNAESNGCENHEHAQNVYTPDGQRAVIAPEELHHGAQTIYYCSKKK